MMEATSPASETAPLIELSDVKLSQQRTAAHGSIDWRIMPGDFWVIGGLHGSGRAELIATATGLQPARQGSVRLFGSDVSELREEALLKARLKIGIVFERGGRIFNHLTVAENVALPLRYHHNWTFEEASTAVERVLKRCDLIEHAAFLAGSLSVPWQQQVALARALALQPEVLFLDKPLSSVDQRRRDWWLKFLDDLSAGREWMAGCPMTLVVTADDLTAWLDHGKQFAVLKNNRWQVLGTASELKAGNSDRLSELWIEDMA